MAMKSNQTIPINTLCLAVLTVIASGFALKMLRLVLLPFTIALLFAFLFQPAVEKLHDKARIPRAVSALGLIILTFGLFFLMGWVFFLSFKNFMLVFSDFTPRIVSIANEISNSLNLPPEIAASLSETLSGAALLNRYLFTLSSAFFNVTGLSVSFASQVFLVTLFTLFMLLEFKNFRYKFGIAFTADVAGRFAEIGRHISKQISHYLSVKTFISALTGFAIFISLAAIGVNFAGMWGILGFLLNYIPTVGSALVMIMTMSMGFIQFYPEPGPIAAVLISMPLIQTVLGQILDPRMQGAKLDLSPLFVLLSLSLWGWLWGIPGMFISVPLTVCLKIILTHFGPFSALARLMGEGKPPQAGVSADSQSSNIKEQP